MSKQVDLDDLGLGDAIDVDQLVKDKPPIEDPHRMPVRPRRVATAESIRAAHRPPARPQPVDQYRGLRSHIAWLSGISAFGSVCSGLLIFIGLGQDTWSVVSDGIWGVIAFNVLRLVASLASLALDARLDLAELAKKNPGA